jgi:SNF family Na+-dependent transporter
MTGAFLIPFAVMLILEGIPLFLIELGMGQKMRLGSLGVWNTIHPWLGGIGIASCVVTFFVALYYNVIITWCFYYLFNSLQVTHFVLQTCAGASNVTCDLCRGAEGQLLVQRILQVTLLYLYLYLYLYLTTTGCHCMLACLSL